MELSYKEELRKEIREILKSELKEVLGETTSFINPEEEEEAKAFIEKHLGFPPPVMSNFWMAVKIYYDEKDLHHAKNEDGTPKLDLNGNPIVFYLPESANPHEKYKSCTALVVSQGPACYKGDRFKYCGRSCKVGDWIIIAPNEGHYLVYRGVPMRMIADDKCMGLTEDPEYITRT